MYAEDDEHESALNAFKEFTGQQNDEDAKRLLAICQWDVEQAINVFFMRKSRITAHNDVINGVGLPAAAAAAKIDHYQTTAAASGENDCAKRKRPPAAEGEQLPLIARQNYGIGSSSTTESPYRNEKMSEQSSLERKSNIMGFDHEQMLKENAINQILENARQPTIPPTQGTVIEQQNDTVFEQFAGSSSTQILSFEQLRAPHRAGLKPNTRMHLGCKLVFDGISRVPLRTEASLGGSTSTNNEDEPKINRILKNLCRPPTELMFRGDWDQALSLAKKQKMWLLVNVQNSLEFASAKLNRDVWSAETVQATIKANFILWQVYHDSSDGSRVRAYYFVDGDSSLTYPLIFIVDPRTGEEVQRLSGASLDEAAFLDSLTTFLADNPSFESRYCQFVGKAIAGQIQAKKQIQSTETTAVDSCWTPADLSADEWTKWTVNNTNLVKPFSDTVQLSLRLPNGQTERIQLWKAAPLSALFSLLLSKGHSSTNNYQLVLDYPRREFVLSNQNRFRTLHELGFGPQEVIHVNRIEE